MNLSPSTRRSVRTLCAGFAVALVELALASGRLEAQCTLAAAPVQFEPRPPGATRPGSLSTGFSTALALYQTQAGAPRMMMYEAFGYSVLDLSNPGSPTAIKYDDFRVDPSSPTQNTITAHGDGQSYIATMGISPDGQRAAFSVNGPADPPWHTLVGRSDGNEGIGIWGDFAPSRASGGVVQKSGSRYIAYTIHATINGTAADVTTLPTNNVDFQPLNLASETTSFVPGQSLMLAGNYLVYMADFGVQVIDASNPGPPGAITSAFKKAAVTSVPGDPYARIPANFTAAVDPADPTKLWVLVELGAAAGEKSPSYGLVSITRDGNGNLSAPASAGAIFRVPAVAGELWGRSGNSASLVASNGQLFALMWGTRILPGQQFWLYSTTASGWATPSSAQVSASGFTSLAASSAAALAGAGNSVYVYLPTGPAAFVVPLTCAPVNAPAVSGLTVTNASAGGASVSDGATVFAGDQLTIVPTVIPSPASKPVSSWGFDFDFHAGVPVEDNGVGVSPRIKIPDNVQFGSPPSPPAQATLVGPCDPQASGSPNSGAACWTSVQTNSAFGGPDWTGAEQPGATKPQKIAFEATNAYGSANTVVFTVNWKLPAARIASTQVLSGQPLTSASDGHPATNGFKWYFGPTPASLALAAGCDTATCVPTLGTKGTYFYWLTATYSNGYQTPDYAGSVAMGTYTVTDFAPSFAVNGSATGPITALISSNVSVTNSSQRGAGIAGTYKYNLCLVPCGADAFAAWNMTDPANGTGTPPSTANIPMPSTAGTYALKIQITYANGTTTTYWPDPANVGTFTINVTAVTPKFRIWVNGANPCPPGVFCIENQVTAHVGDALVAHAQVNGVDDPNDGTDHWDFSSAPGGSTASPQFVNGNPVSLQYTGVGVFDITLTRSGVPYVFPNSAVITARPNNVSVSASANPNPVQSGQSVTFSCSATGGSGSGYSYTWSGSLGTISTQQNFSFTPSNSSGSNITQQISCGVTDSAGASGSSTVNLVVTPAGAGGAVTVQAQATPNPVSAGQPVVFGCLASGGSGSFSYVWSSGFNTLSNQQSFTFNTTAGMAGQSQQVTCTATDTSNQKIGTANVNLNIIVPPIACQPVDFKVYRNGVQIVETPSPFGTPLPMAASAGDVLNFSITLGFPTQFRWNFGEGPTIQGIPTDPAINSPTHTYTAAGSYTITLQPTCSDGTFSGGTSYRIQITGPSGDFTPGYSDGSPFVVSNVTAGKTVRFTATEAAATSYDWDFGDNSTHGSGASVTHVFSTSGARAVKLSVVKSGATASSTLTLTVVLPPEPPRWVAPGMAYLGGAIPGTLWTSDVTLFNPDPALAQRLQVAFLDATQPLQAGESPSFVALNPIAPMASFTVANALAVLGRPLGSYGALLVKGDATVAALAPVIVSRTFNDQSAQGKGTFGLSVPSTSASTSGGVSAQAAPAASVLVGLRQNAAAYTNFALVNLNGEWPTVQLDLYDGATAAALGTMAVPMNPYQSLQINKILQDGRLQRTAAWADASDLFTVKVSIVPVGPDAKPWAVYPYATLIDARSTDPIVVTPTAAPGNTYRIPGVVRLTGAKGEKWRSRVTVTNPSTTARRVNLKYSFVPCDASGACLDARTYSASVSMAPGQTQSWDDFVKVWFPAKYGAVFDETWTYKNSLLDVSPEPGDANVDPLVVLGETYNDTPDGHVGLQVPGYGPLDGASRSGAGANGNKRLVLTGLRSDSSAGAGFRTNVALFLAAGSTGGWCSAHVYSLEGTKLNDIPIQVSPLAQLSDATLLAGVASPPTKYSIVIDNFDDGIAVAGYATIIDNTSGDSTFVKAQPVP